MRNVSEASFMVIDNDGNNFRRSGVGVGVGAGAGVGAMYTATTEYLHERKKRASFLPTRRPHQCMLSCLHGLRLEDYHHYLSIQHHW